MEAHYFVGRHTEQNVPTHHPASQNFSVTTVPFCVTPPCMLPCCAVPPSHPMPCHAMLRKGAAPGLLAAESSVGGRRLGAAGSVSGGSSKWASVRGAARKSIHLARFTNILLGCKVGGCVRGRVGVVLQHLGPAMQCHGPTPPLANKQTRVSRISHAAHDPAASPGAQVRIVLHALGGRAGGQAGGHAVHG